MHGIIQRAFEIARSGVCKTPREIELILAKEGYENAVSHLTGHQFRRQLYKAMRESNTPANAQGQDTALLSSVNP